MHRSSFVAAAPVLVASLFLACSGGGARSGFDNSSDPNSPGSDGTNGGGGGSGSFGPGGGEGGAPTGACVPNPANFDIPGNNCDDDGDGKVDNPPVCDGSISGNAAVDFAHAIGICDDASSRGFGLVSATFVQGGDPQHGVLPKFGDVIKPREGSALAVLSTGYGQEYDGSANAPFGGASGSGLGGFKLNGKDWGKPGTAPPGFPKNASGCGGGGGGAVPVNDVVQLKLQVKAPPNVSGIKFDFDFYSGEWPAYVCSNFNDGFIAYLTAAGFNGGKPDNMSFDSKNNPVSVNNGFFDRCTQNVAIGCANPTGGGTSACPGGPSELSGTGFGLSGQWCKPFALGGGGNDTSTNGGATGWLTSKAPVNAGETFTLELYIWDAGDGMLDSSVILDNFTWVEGQVATSTERPN